MKPTNAIAVLEALLRADRGLKPQTQDRRGHNRRAAWLTSREREALRLAVAHLTRALQETPDAPTP